MPERFFLDHPAAAGAPLVIEGPLGHHLGRVLRVRRGERLVVVAGDEEVGAEVTEAGPARVVLAQRWRRPATGEPRLHVTIVQALPRERMEDCVDILAEAGVAAIRPVLTERVVVRGGAERLSHRLERWRSVALEAAQLSGRGSVPVVHHPARLEEALGELPAATRILALEMEATAALSDVDVDASMPHALVIGPEGGLGDADRRALERRGATLVHMGARTLRTRYAGAIATALLLHSAGDLAAGAPPAPW